MEELRSTSILDREIEADAKKKAAKILENAERECKEIAENVDQRLKKSLEEKSLSYKNKISQLEKNAQAYIPLEKERFLVSFYDEQVCKAMNSYFDSIGEKGRLSLLASKLDSFKQVLEDKNINAKYFGGLKEADVKNLLENFFNGKLNSVQGIQFEKSGEQAVQGNSLHEGIVIESEDEAVKIRLTIDEVVRELKDKYSYELAATLFGGKLPQ
ncbi:hypothetical protein HRO26_02880 [Treponema pectinovorum]|uniref:hypothetical protein n=1 Tax=Treponema pectinovorum TaxID=164 RepID=UPI003D8E86FE